MKNNIPQLNKKLQSANNKLLELVHDKFMTQIIVGSFSYGRYSMLKEESDLDCVFICKQNDVYNAIKETFFRNIVNARQMQLLLDRNIVQYIKLKFFFENVEFNIEIVPFEFFCKICRQDLIHNLQKDNSKCYLNYQPVGFYHTLDFTASKTKIEYHYSECEKGYILDLPIHHLVERDSRVFYSYGFMVIKLLIPWLVYGDYCIKSNLDNLFTGVVGRFNYEKKTYSDIAKEYQFEHLFIRNLPNELKDSLNIWVD